MLSAMPGIQITSVFMVIRFVGKIKMPQFGIFPVMVAGSLLSNVATTTLSSFIYLDSGTLLKSYRSGLASLGTNLRKERSILKRELRACTELKIKLGSNFIDERTPLVMQNFCWTQTVSLMLVVSNRVGH